MKKIGILLIALTATTSVMADPCCDPCPSSCFNGYVDFLWWSACGDQLDYGLLTEGDRVTTGTPEIETLTEKMFVVSPDWNPGVRVGVAKQMDCSPFSFFAEWTWYQTNTNTKTNLTRPQGADVVYTFASDFFRKVGEGFRSFESGIVDADFCFQMNRVDIGFANICCSCNQLVIRPYIAGAFVYTNEDLHVKAEFANPFGESFFQRSNYKTQTSYCGAGSKVGLAVDWQFNNCFTFYLEGAITGLWGKFDLRNKTLELITGDPDSDIDATITFKHDEWCGRFMSQLQVGLRYRKTWCQNSVFYTQLGWEHQALFDQTNWLVKQAVTVFAPRGSKFPADLILQGLVARVGVEY